MSDLDEIARNAVTGEYSSVDDLLDALEGEIIPEDTKTPWEKFEIFVDDNIKSIKAVGYGLAISTVGIGALMFGAEYGQDIANYIGYLVSTYGPAVGIGGIVGGICVPLFHMFRGNTIPNPDMDAEGCVFNGVFGGLGGAVAGGAIMAITMIDINASNGVAEIGHYIASGGAGGAIGGFITPYIAEKFTGN